MALFIIPSSLPLEREVIIKAFREAKSIEKRGRGYIKLLSLDDQAFFVRKYIHGGLFRIFTRDLFLSGKRAKREMEILNLLNSKGFPVPKTLCIIEERLFIFKRLYIVEEWKKETEDLIDHLKNLKGLRKFRIIRKFALLFSLLCKEGVFLKDLHLRNVVVGKEGNIYFVDFDRAEIKGLERKNVRNMLLRLERYVEKMAWKGILKTEKKERLFFLRICEKTLGFDFKKDIVDSFRKRRYFYRIGWSFERLLGQI